MNALPLEELAKLLFEAQALVSASKLREALKINDRVRVCGFSLVVRDGDVCLQSEPRAESNSVETEMGVRAHR
jgi:hypothetical protein